MEYEQQIKLQQKEMHSLDGSSEKPVTSSSSVEGATKKGLSLTLGGSLSRGMKKSFSLNFAPQREKPVVVQSPTTALARLNFNSAPSPIEESTSESPLSAQSHLNFPQFPTTSLDKLSFTPCFAKEDQPHPRHSLGTNNNSSKSPSGTKRPLSTSSIDHPQDSHPPSTNAQMSLSGEKNASNAPKVMCRSPEMRAKRPLVRPNSIAFSSYPKFDFPSEHCSKSSPIEQQQQQKAESNISGTSDRNTSNKNPKDSTQNAESPALQTCIRETDGCGRALQNFTRKSQSLEDILNSQEEEDDETADWMMGLAHNKRGKHSHSMIHAADIFSQPLALDRVQGRCRGPSDPHQSSSSISSSGSHNSLQGSLEMIPVSWYWLIDEILSCFKLA